MLRQVRQVGDVQIEIDGTNQPEGWRFVNIRCINGGVNWYTGVVPVDEVPMDVIVNIERVRAYERALEAQRIEGS